MIHRDITQTNAAVERLIARTDNPRHRFLLEAFNRHRYLEMAGRYREIFAPDMMVEEPVYRFSLKGKSFTLTGRSRVEALYAHWTATDQTVFYAEGEQLAVSDDMIVSRGIVYQQTSGAALAADGADVDSKGMYLVRAAVTQCWPYDDRCRLLGEDVWEHEHAENRLIRLEPQEVLTTRQAGELLAPLIRRLPTLPA